MKRLSQRHVLLVLVASCLFYLPKVEAKKPDNPSGGGGGGTSAPYSLVDLGGFVGGILATKQAPAGPASPFRPVDRQK